MACSRAGRYVLFAAIALWGGMLVMIGGLLGGVFTIGDSTGTPFKLALVGVACGMSLMAWGARAAD